MPTTRYSPLLRELARRAIRSGTLPTQDPIAAWGSWSFGRSCGACGADTAEIGLEFLIGGQRLACSLHPRCWLAWEEVRAGMG